MDKINATSLKRSAAGLAIAAGFVTGAVLSSPWVAQGEVNTGMVNHVDPNLPAVTIVAKRLTRGEKRRFANQDRSSVVSTGHVGDTDSDPGASLQTQADSDVLRKTASVR